jgi:hypothetical protein
MEGYSTKDATCTQTVQAFLAAWTNELHAQGFVASVYGSAASTIRDTAAVSPPPDQVWIANWNGNASVFGDPYVSDTLWPNHQRIHQYKGGHRETWGGVTIDVDSNYVDAQVVGPVVAPPPPPPTPPGGSVGSGDNQATATWPSGAFASTAVVTLTPTPLSAPPAGYGSGYAVTLAVADAASNPPVPVTTFTQPVTVHVVPQPTPGVPLFSADGGATWQPLPRLATAKLPPGVAAGYVANADGSTDVLTLHPGIVALLPDQTPPSQPSASGKFAKGTLRLSWTAATDNSGRVASYAVLLDGSPLETVPASQRHAVVHAFHPAGITVYRIQATDAAGNAGKPSAPVVVVPSRKPAPLPRPIPRWAWNLFAWQHQHTGVRPKTPKPFPAWYWRWAAWRLQPFRLR